MNHPNHQLIERFYQAFHQHDGDTMAACYHSDATFRDAVFDLRGTAIGDMWRMLTKRAHDLRIEVSQIEANENSGKAFWIAHYTFSATKRSVVNRIHARFRFHEGLIIEHIDDFSFWKWSRQALGPIGWALGWTPWLKRKVSRNVAQLLAEFQSRLRAE